MMIKVNYVNALPEDIFNALDEFIRSKYNIPRDAWITSDGKIDHTSCQRGENWREYIRAATQEDKDVMKLLKDLKECLK